MEKQKLNTTLIYVLSILGFLCCCVGGLGIIPSGIAFFLSNKQLKEAYADHERFENIEAMKTAKTIALIVTIICAITLLYNIYDLSTGGWERRQEAVQQFMEQMQQN